MNWRAIEMDFAIEKRLDREAAMAEGKAEGLLKHHQSGNSLKL